MNSCFRCFYKSIIKNNIMKSLLFIVLVIGATLTTFSQNAKHKNYFKGVDPIENETYRAVIVNSVSNIAYCKFGLKLTNLTNDYLIIRLKESTFILDGTAHKMNKDKEVFVYPNKGKSITYNAAGDEGVNYHVDEFDFTFDGVYKLPADGEVHVAPDFNLPASVNEITFGDFKVKLKKLKKETKVTEAIFTVTYLGDDYGLVDASKISVTIPEKGDKVFANNSKKGVKIVEKGKSVQIKALFNVSAKYADMQFANMNILWNNAFQSSILQKIQGETISFELDPGLTEGKN